MNELDFGRRRFMGGAAAALAAAGGGLDPAAAAEPFPATLLVDDAGVPVKAGELLLEETYVFLYPHVSTPCLLVRLPQAAAAGSPAQGESWPGGVGNDRAVVAYLAVCAHAFSYNSRQTSFLAYRPLDGMAPGVIRCCAHGSVYAAGAGARVLDGPAPTPLTAVRLQHDAVSDQLRAVGLSGVGLVDAFFQAFRADLNAEYGRGAYRAPIGERTTLMRLSAYSDRVADC